MGTDSSASKLLMVAAVSASASAALTYAVMRRNSRARSKTAAARRSDHSSCCGTPPTKRDPYDPSPRTGYLSWDDYFMAVAFLSAQRSKDPNKQVGACIVDQNQVICGIGYNGFPRGCHDSTLPWAKKARGGDPLHTKYPYVCHAEMNAILNKNGASVAGAKIYVTMFPCNECAKLLIQAGIKEIVYHEDKLAPSRPASPNKDGFRPDQQYAASRKLLALAGVALRQHRFRSPVTLRLTNHPAYPVLRNVDSAAVAVETVAAAALAAAAAAAAAASAGQQHQQQETGHGPQGLPWKVANGALAALPSSCGSHTAGSHPWGQQQQQPPCSDCHAAAQAPAGASHPPARAAAAASGVGGSPAEALLALAHYYSSSQQEEQQLQQQEEDGSRNGHGSAPGLAAAGPTIGAPPIVDAAWASSVLESLARLFPARVQAQPASSPQCGLLDAGQQQGQSWEGGSAAASPASRGPSKQPTGQASSGESQGRIGANSAAVAAEAPSAGQLGKQPSSLLQDDAESKDPKQADEEAAAAGLAAPEGGLVPLVAVEEALAASAAGAATAAAGDGELPGTSESGAASPDAGLE